MLLPKCPMQLTNELNKRNCFEKTWAFNLFKNYGARLRIPVLADSRDIERIRHALRSQGSALSLSSWRLLCRHLHAVNQPRDKRIYEIEVTTIPVQHRDIGRFNCNQITENLLI